MSAPSDPGTTDQFAGFGPNEWLVYEMYQQWLKDTKQVKLETGISGQVSGADLVLLIPDS